MPTANMELGYATLGTLHERVGENQALAWDNCGSCGKEGKSQTWTRIFAKHLEVDGKERLNMESDMYVLQLGHDFKVDHNLDNDSRRHTGVMASYGHSDVDFYDRYRAVNGKISADQFTGKAKTDAASLGLYSTYYANTGSYLDLVGQVSYLRNKYQARNGTDVSQNGWSAAVSAEAGRPYAIKDSQWLIEPQAQVIYQYLHLNGFNDGAKEVKQNNSHGVRGRVGARLAYNQSNDQHHTKTFYGLANVWHDFTAPKAVHVGRDSAKEKYNQTWAEVGLGLQLPAGKESYIYADGRYEHSLGGKKHAGYRGTIGFKHTWK